MSYNTAYTYGNQYDTSYPDNYSFMMSAISRVSSLNNLLQQLKPYLHEQHTIRIMKDFNSTILSISDAVIDREFCSKCCEALQESLSNEFLDMGVKYQYFQFLDKLSKNYQYSYFINYVLETNNSELIEAILLFLAQKKFDLVLGNEENFLIESLKIKNPVIQEFALNTLILSGKSNYISALKTIKIDDRYLQKKLNKFLNV